jgi:hypothetical protein
VGGTQRNHAPVSESVDWNGLAENEQLLLADAQTSGGLLFASPATPPQTWWRSKRTEPRRRDHRRNDTGSAGAITIR